MAQCDHVTSIVSIFNFFLCVLLFSLGAAQKTKDVEPGHKRVCYYTNWSQYRRDQGKFMPADIDPFLCTHLIFSFAKIEKGVLAPYEWNDLQYPFLYKQFNALKLKNPALKTLLAVGGWTHGSQPFTEMVANKATRKKFIEHAIDYIRSHEFDGLDLDWEYPANRGSPAEDKDRFVLLAQELREAFEQEAKKSGKSRLLLTAAVPGGERLAKSGYNVKQLNKYLDIFNLMSYDLHGSWSPLIGHHAPLFGGEKWFEKKSDSLNVESSVNLWLDMGVDPHKLVMGLALYGKTFKLCSKGHQPGDKGCGGANPDTLNYYEIAQRLKAGKLQKIWLENEVAPYAYSIADKIWVGFDDEESLRAKVNFAKKKNLGGIMVWSIDGDDFSGKFGDGNKYPLMNAIKDAVEGKQPENDRKADKKPIKTEPVSVTTGTPTDQPQPTKPKPAPYSDLEKELFKKPEAVPLRANLFTNRRVTPASGDPVTSTANTQNKVSSNPEPNSAVHTTGKSSASPDRKSSPIPDRKWTDPEGKNTSVYTAAAELREKLQQSKQFKPRPVTGSSTVMTSSTKPGPTATATLVKQNSRVRGQHKRLPQQNKESVSVYKPQQDSFLHKPQQGSVLHKPQQDSFLHKPPMTKYSTTNFSKNSVLKSTHRKPEVATPAQRSTPKVSGVRWYTDKNLATEESVRKNTDKNLATEESVRKNTDKSLATVESVRKNTDKNLATEESVSKTRTAPTSPRHKSFTKSKKRPETTSQDETSPGSIETRRDSSAQKQSTFGHFVTLYPEEQKGRSTDVLSDGPSWATKLMTEKAVTSDQTTNKETVTPKQSTVTTQAEKSNPNKHQNIQSGDTFVRTYDSANKETAGQNSESKVVIKSTQSASNRGKAPRRHQNLPTPYKSLSPFAANKAQYGLYENVPKISKYSLTDEQLSGMAGEFQKRPKHYKYVTQKTEQEVGEKSDHKSGGKWWDNSKTTDGATTGLPPLSTKDSAGSTQILDEVRTQRVESPHRVESTQRGDSTQRVESPQTTQTGGGNSDTTEGYSPSQTVTVKDSGKLDSTAIAADNKRGGSTALHKTTPISSPTLDTSPPKTTWGKFDRKSQEKTKAHWWTMSTSSASDVTSKSSSSTSDVTSKSTSSTSDVTPKSTSSAKEVTSTRDVKSKFTSSASDVTSTSKSSVRDVTSISTSSASDLTSKSTSSASDVTSTSRQTPTRQKLVQDRRGKFEAKSPNTFKVQKTQDAKSPNTFKVQKTQDAKSPNTFKVQKTQREYPKNNSFSSIVISGIPGAPGVVGKTTDQYNTNNAEPSEAQKLKEEEEADEQEGKNSTTSVLAADNEIVEDPPEIPEVQPYHAQLTLKTLKHTPSPEKIYHYKHENKASEVSHVHQRVNKMAENEIPRKTAEATPSGVLGSDARDWSKIRNLLRNSTVVSEIKSKLDEIHKSVTLDLVSDVTTPVTSPAETTRPQKSEVKWYQQEKEDVDNVKKNVVEDPADDTLKHSVQSTKFSASDDVQVAAGTNVPESSSKTNQDPETQSSLWWEMKKNGGKVGAKSTPENKSVAKPAGNTKETSQGKLKETSHETMKEASRGVMKEASRGVMKEASRGVMKEASRGMMKDVSRGEMTKEASHKNDHVNQVAASNTPSDLKATNAEHSETTPSRPTRAGSTVWWDSVMNSIVTDPSPEPRTRAEPKTEPITELKTELNLNDVLPTNEQSNFVNPKLESKEEKKSKTLPGDIYGITTEKGTDQTTFKNKRPFYTKNVEPVAFTSVRNSKLSAPRMTGVPSSLGSKTPLTNSPSLGSKSSVTGISPSLGHKTPLTSGVSPSLGHKTPLTSGVSPSLGHKTPLKYTAKQTERPRDYSGYLVSNYKLEGVRKNSASFSSVYKNYKDSKKGHKHHMEKLNDSIVKSPEKISHQNQVPQAFQAKNIFIDLAGGTKGQMPYVVSTGTSKDLVFSKKIVDANIKYGKVLPSGNFKCPSTFGIYADPEDCRMFYQCVWYVSFHHMCGRGTAWNKEDRICDWPKRTDCPLPTDEADV